MDKEPVSRDEVASAFLEHLVYETEAMVRVAAWYSELLKPNSGPVMLYVACLESMLLHCRVLIEFLIGRPHGRGRNRNDFGAPDLLPAWDDRAEIDVDGLSDFCDILDKVLAHLSLLRLEDHDGRIDVLDGVNLTFRSMKLFVLALETADSPAAPRLRFVLDSREETFPLQRRVSK